MLTRLMYSAAGGTDQTGEKRCVEDHDAERWHGAELGLVDCSTPRSCHRVRIVDPWGTTVLSH
jgi:hypothetical protein